jgi:hypothetical protein
MMSHWSISLPSPFVVYKERVGSAWQLPAGFPTEDARLASGCCPLYQAGLITRRVSYQSGDYVLDRYFLTRFAKGIGPLIDVDQRADQAIALFRICLF